MATKTVSLSEDAYDRLKRHKKENESFSDLVKRICSDVKLENYYGILSDEEASELRDTIRERRDEHREHHEKRLSRLYEESK